MSNTSCNRPAGFMHVAELADSAGVTPATIRHYARVGLLQASRDPHNGYRHFALSDVDRVSFIRRAQGLGLKIAEIKVIMETAERGETPCRLVRNLIEERLAEISKRIDALHATRRRILDALDEWEENEPGRATGARFCPLIEARR